jgi:hypothetical protein
MTPLQYQKGSNQRICASWMMGVSGWRVENLVVVQQVLPTWYSTSTKEEEAGHAGL